MLQSQSEAEPKSRKPRVQSILILLIVLIIIGMTAWVLATVATGSQIPPSDFVAMPTTPFSTAGDKVQFTSVSDIAQNGLAAGVQGYLKTVSGAPVSAGTVYVTYYADGSYRTQVTTTDQNGHFVFHFPVNWTGWLPVTLTYFGDNQHQGLRQGFQVAGEGP